MMQISKVQKNTFLFHMFLNVTKHLYIHLLSVDAFSCQAKKNANLPLPWESHSQEMYSVVMQKNVCEIPNFKGESPPHPRTIAPTSWDPNTAEPTLAPWRLTSCHGAGDENGVSAPLSPSHRCRRHSSPCEGSKPHRMQPLGGSGIRYPDTSGGNYQLKKSHGFYDGFWVLWIHPFEFGGCFGIFEVSTEMYGIFTYSCFIFYGTCMQM